MERVDASVELVARKYIYALFPYSCVAFHAFFFSQGDALHQAPICRGRWIACYAGYIEAIAKLTRL